MGGSGPTKQTLEQTQQQLLKTLYESANKLLISPQPVPEKVTEQELTNLVSKVAREHFKKRYNYDYNGQATKPVPPSPDPGSLNPTDGICSYPSIDDNGVKTFVEVNILGGVQNETIKKAAGADLIGLGKNLFYQATNVTWRVQYFTKDYHYQEKAKNQYSIRSHSVFVYTNSNLMVDGQEAKFVIISFIGVYFHVTSLEKQVRDNLFSIIISNAKSLKPIGTDSGDELQRIRVVLEPYLKDQFRIQNLYDYDAGNTKPPDMAPGTQPLVRGAVIPCYPNTNSVEDVVSYVEVNVLGAMDNLPKYLTQKEGAAHKDLLQHFTTLLGQPASNSWTPVPFNKTYDSPNDGENSTRTSAIMLYTNSSLTQGEVTAKQLYLYYMGVYYRVKAPKFAARDMLFDHLKASAHMLDKDLPDPKGLTPQETLLIVLDEFAKRQFKNRIGFPYQKPVGDTKPDDLAPGKKVVGLSTLMYFETNPVDSRTIGDKVDGSIIGQVLISEWLKKSLKESLVKRIKLDTDDAKLDFWISNLYQNQFSNRKNDYKDSGVLPINLRSVITYVNGRVIESGKEIILTMVHFLGIIYSTNVPVLIPKPGEAPLEVEEYDNCIITTLH